MNGFGPPAAAVRAEEEIAGETLQDRGLLKNVMRRAGLNTHRAAAVEAGR
jgi:hypothetical protein